MESKKVGFWLAAAQIGLGVVAIIIAIIFWASFFKDDGYYISDSIGGTFIAAYLVNVLTIIAAVVIGILQIINGAKTKNMVRLAAGIVSILGSFMNFGLFTIFVPAIIIIIMNIFAMVMVPKDSATTTPQEGSATIN